MVWSNWDCYFHWSVYCNWGLKAVIYTETLQTIILIAGSVIITYLGLTEVGGWSNLRETVGPEHFNMWRPMSDPNFPWTGLLFGGTIVGIWYWCTDQYIVQRTLALIILKLEEEVQF